MSLFKILFKKQKIKRPEEEYVVIKSDEFVKVEHNHIKTGEINWKNISTIKIINNAEGPWYPDIFIKLIGDKESCTIPYNAKGFDAVYDIISKYSNFNFENFINSMINTEKSELVLWTRQRP